LAFAGLEEAVGGGFFPGDITYLVEAVDVDFSILLFD